MQKLDNNIKMTHFAVIDAAGNVYGVGRTAFQAQIDANEWTENSSQLRVVPCSETASLLIQDKGYTVGGTVYIVGIGVMTAAEFEAALPGPVPDPGQF